MLMNVLFDNPLANLRGPEFLFVYAAIAVLAIVAGRLISRGFDETKNLPVPPVPPEIDPYELAYLRGGHAEYVRLVILDLVQRKYLQQVEVKGVLGTATPKLDQ